MKVVLPITVLLAVMWLPEVITEQQALFVRKDAVRNGRRVTRQTSADQMVQNILQWLQGVYTKNSRRIRQGSFREYLPPSNTQKPRPFQPSITTPGQSGDGDFNFIGYPPSGSINPQPPFPLYPDQPPISPGFPEFSTRPNLPDFPSQPPPGRPDFNTQPPGYPGPGFPGYPTQSPPTNGPNTYIPPISTNFPPDFEYTTSPPEPPSSFPTRPPTQPTQPPTPSTHLPTQPTFPPTLPPTFFTQPPTQPTHPPTLPPYSPTYPSTLPSLPPTQPTHPPTQPTYPPTQPTQPPTQPTHPPTQPTHPPTQPTYPPTQPTYPPTQPTHPPTQPTHPPTLPTHPVTEPTHPTTQPPQTFFPTHPPTTHPPATPPPFTIHTEPPRPFHPATEPVELETETPYPPHTQPPGSTTHPTNIFTSPAITYSPKPEDNTVHPGDNTPTDTELEGTLQPSDEDLKHPPHIHSIDVQCAKDMMTIHIEFNRPFDGVIYSKGYYHQPDCRYVQEHSGQTRYTFTVSLNSCGTDFVNAFDTQGQSYLENVLVLQNEPGIQEVWDTIRAVRCLWEGNLNKALSVALSVGMLNQEIVTFSGDTAMAKLDIQLGKGPFAPNAHGLVKIGEVMTLVVSVTGDPGFDIQVKDCRAKDSSGQNEVKLTDEQGCVLKPKLLGAFQKTRQTGNTGASIIAYAYFNAFKFPDMMDLMIECNVELCKTDCEVCPNPHQQIDPGRRRKREINNTIAEPVTVGKMLRVIVPEDISDNQIWNLNYNGICLSTESFAISSVLLISLLTASCLFSASLWLRNRNLLQKF